MFQSTHSRLAQCIQASNDRIRQKRKIAEMELMTVLRDKLVVDKLTCSASVGRVAAIPERECSSGPTFSRPYVTLKDRRLLG